MSGKPNPGNLSHIDGTGTARMVDVTSKSETHRQAVAESFLRLSQSTLKLISSGSLPKGNAIETARLAGIMAAKKTAEIIPLCHPLQLTFVDVIAQPHRGGIRFRAQVSCKGPTGVEMEAMTAAAVAALTLYDMVKAVEKAASIERVILLEKSGGKSGVFKRPPFEKQP
jgi:cyclic pyranopterin monophosphate synthase